MNWLDIIILVIVAASTFIGLKSGLIKMALSLAGLIIGIILAGRYYVSLAKQLTLIQQDNIAQAVAFAIILIVVMIVASLLALILKMIVSAVMLGWVNHLGGALFGFVLGAAFCAALLTLGVKFPTASATIKGSGLAALLLDRFPAILNLLPAEFGTIRSFFQ